MPSISTSEVVCCVAALVGWCLFWRVWGKRIGNKIWGIEAEEDETLQP